VHRHCDCAFPVAPPSSRCLELQAALLLSSVVSGTVDGTKPTPPPRPGRPLQWCAPPKLARSCTLYPALDDHTDDDELSVYSLPAQMAEVLRSNEYVLNEGGSVENEIPVLLPESGQQSLATEGLFASVPLPT
jgi:hypothetical protein